MKILYVILHGSINPDRYYNVKETWGKDVDCLFYSDHRDVKKNIIKVSDRNDYHSNEPKHINALTYVSNNITGYDWFFFCDDDTFVNTKKLNEFVIDIDKESVHGSSIKGSWSRDPSLDYCSGGAGYLIHFDLLKKIKKHVKVFNSGYSDVSLGMTLRELNIKSINHDVFRSQPPEFYNYNINDFKNFISFHYIKTKEDMLNILNNI